MMYVPLIPGTCHRCPGSEADRMGPNGHAAGAVIGERSDQEDAVPGVV